MSSERGGSLAGAEILIRRGVTSPDPITKWGAEGRARGQIKPACLQRSFIISPFMWMIPRTLESF